MSPLLIRALVALGLLAGGAALYWLFNRMILFRANQKTLGLAAFKPGKPAVLYFTMPGCVPCRTTQRPALEKLAGLVGDQVQIIEVDVVEQPALAESWGVLSVPTTFIIDPQGRPRSINHGVALAEKLIDQLEQVLEHPLLSADLREKIGIRLSAAKMD